MKRLVTHNIYCSMRTYMLAALSLCVFCSSYARGNEPATEDNDTVATNLREFVVESKNAWIENDKAVFVPTRREKNRANSPASLISSMNNPLLTVDSDGNIKNLRGDNVPVFINGIEAQDIDLSTFWPKDVIRVEYYSDPTDPKFKGYSSVVNFIVPVYATGGVTKVNTYQCLSPYIGDYDIASKLVYKKMTYGANVTGYYGNTGVTQEDKTTYRDIWYNGQKYDRIDNTSNISSKTRRADVNAAFSATYNNDKIRIEHTMGLLWSKGPVFNNDEGISDWNPNLFGTCAYWSKTSANTLSPWLRGFYIFTFHPKVRIETLWKYTYASADEESSNQTGSAPIISNAHDEKTHNLYVAGNFSYTLRDNLKFSLTSRNKTTFYNIDYTGSYNNNYRQIFGVYIITPGVMWTPKTGLSFTLLPYLTISQRKIQDEKQELTINPNVYISANWYQTDKAYLNFWYKLSTSQVQASHANDVVQRESELIWYMGTLDLLSYNSMNLGLQQTWMCTPWFTPTFLLQYINFNHSYYRQYDAARRIWEV